MPKPLSILPGLALSALLFATHPAMAEETPQRDTVVAVVNGQDITLGHMALTYATLPQQFQQLPDDVLFSAILDQLIRQTALSQTVSDEIPAYVAMALDNERRSLLANESLEQYLADAVSEDDLRAAYDSEFAGVEPGQEYNASHILVATEDEARDIKAELDEGADFATTAQARSTGPSGPNGGNLNWFGAGQMVPDFEAAVVALTPGEVSEPVETQFGWHIIKLNDSRPVAAPTFDEVREQLVERVQSEKVEAYLTGLLDEATVERPDVSDVPQVAIRDLGILRN